MKIKEYTKIFFYHYSIYIISLVYFAYIFGFYFFSDYLPISLNFEKNYILGGDSPRYIEGANKISNFKLPDGKGTNNLGYIFYLAIFKYFKLDLSFVVLSQIILTFISSLCLYRISKKISSTWVAYFIFFLYLFYLPLQVFNFYILTETIFICLIIFILYFLIFFKKKYIPLLLVLIFFYIFFRPHGIILVPALVFSLLIWLYLNNKLILFYSSFISLIILSIPFLYLLNLYLNNQNLVNTLASIDIIWGYKNENNTLQYDTTSVVNNDLLSLLIFIKNNIYSFTIAFFKKIFYFYFRIRPYYSDFHNYYIIFFNIIYLPTAIIGLFKLKNKNNIGFILMYCLIFFFTLAVGFSWADWDGRFSLYIIPIIFIFAGVGLQSLLNYKK